jgi:hypothetical protein
MEAYEKMLETWMDLVTNLKDLPVEVLYPQAQEVFNTYVQCHISAPEGTRTQVGHMSVTGHQITGRLSAVAPDTTYNVTAARQRVPEPG